MGICREKVLKCKERETARKKQTRDRDEKSNSEIGKEVEVGGEEKKEG